MKILLQSFVALAVIVVLSGCYPNRLTENYEQFPLITDSVSSVLNEEGMSEADEKLRLERLKEWEEVPLPPYTISSGDILNIKVYNHPDLDTAHTTVTPDGCISMLFVGQVKVVGMSISEANKLLEEKLDKYIKNPIVGISTYEIHSGTATISGSVQKPDIFPISDGMRLSDLFALAGGAERRLYDGQVLDSADFKNSVFVRNGEQIPLDFQGAIEQGWPYHNILLRKGDYVYIAARTESTVSIFGAVKTPAKKLWNNGIGILELLSYCGLQEEYWPYAIIIRGGINNPTMYRVDLDGILSGRVPNVLLQPNDMVYVPHDDVSEYNVFVRKALPTGQLLNLIMTPYWWFTK